MSLPDSQLERVFDYTKFHITVYLGLGGAIAGSKLIDDTPEVLQDWPFGVFFVSMVVAGVAAGVIASSTAYYATFEDFQRDKLGPWKLKLFKFATWAMIEHTAFWIGILVPSIYLMAFYDPPK